MGENVQKVFVEIQVNAKDQKAANTLVDAELNWMQDKNIARKEIIDITDAAKALEKIDNAIKWFEDSRPMNTQTYMLITILEAQKYIVTSLMLHH